MKKIREIYYLEPNEREAKLSQGIKLVCEDGMTIELTSTDVIADRITPATPPKYELFKDESYYGMWCCRSINDKRFDSPMSFHFMTKSEAEMFKSLIEIAK